MVNTNPRLYGNSEKKGPAIHVFWNSGGRTGGWDQSLRNRNDHFLISFLPSKTKPDRDPCHRPLFYGFRFYYLPVAGSGAFRALTLLKPYFWVSKLIRWAAIAAALVVAFLSFSDAYRYWEAGKQGHQAAASYLGKIAYPPDHYGESFGYPPVIGTVITGFLVTLLKLSAPARFTSYHCIMTRENGLKLQGWLYLIFIISCLSCPCSSL